MNREAIAWSVAAVAGVVALVALASPLRGLPTTPGSETPGVRSDDELRALRRRLLLMQSESGALRAELDRLRRLLEMKKAHEAHVADTGEANLGEGEKRERAAQALGRLEDLVAQLHQDPQQEVYEGLQKVLLDLFRSPIDDPAIFLEKYGATTDPVAKAMILPHLAARLGEGLSGFVTQELERTQDPGVREQLITQLGVHASPEQDATAKEIFLSALSGESSPRARLEAVVALSKVRTPEVDQALLDVAARDSDPAVREAVIRHLAGNPDTRSRVLELLAADPNEHLRKIGECSAALAETPGAG